jgi:hypothetical protein
VNLGGSLPIPCLRRFRRRQALAASHPVADGFAPAELDALPLMLGDCAVCGSVHSTTLPSPRHYVKRTARLYFQRAVPSLVFFRRISEQAEDPLMRFAMVLAAPPVVRPDFAA